MSRGETRWIFSRVILSLIQQWSPRTSHLIADVDGHGRRRFLRNCLVVDEGVGYCRSVRTRMESTHSPAYPSLQWVPDPSPRPFDDVRHPTAEKLGPWLRFTSPDAEPGDRSDSAGAGRPTMFAPPDRFLSSVSSLSFE